MELIQALSLYSKWKTSPKNLEENQHPVTLQITIHFFWTVYAKVSTRVVERNLGRDTNGATKILQYVGPKERGDSDQLYAHNPQLKGKQKSETIYPDNCLNIECFSEREWTNLFPKVAITPGNGNTVVAKPI